MGLNPETLPAHVKAAVDSAMAGQVIVVDDRHAKAAMEYAHQRGETGVVELTLPYPVSANVYWRTRVVTPRAGKPFVSTYVSEEAKDFKRSVALLALQKGVRPLLGEVEVELHLYRPQKSGDLDNRIKVLLDALREIAYGDDAAVVKIAAERHDDKLNPRAVVRVTQRAADLFGLSPE